MRIKDMITQDVFAWYFVNFSPLLPQNDKTSQHFITSFRYHDIPAKTLVVEWRRQSRFPA